MQSAAIQISDMSKAYRLPEPWRWPWRGAKRLPLPPVQALSSITATIEAGEIFGLVGRNGSGKTTLVKSIAGLIEPTCGSIRVDGFDSVSQTLEVRRRVGLITSEDRSCYWRLTGRENLLFFARLHGIPGRETQLRIERWAEAFGVAPILDRAVSGYSLGNRQRLSIIRALLPDPTILLLDEPSRSLDPIVADGFRQMLRDAIHENGRRTVLITSNNLADIEQLCGRVGILVAGRLAAHAPIAELVRRYDPGEAVLVQTRDRAGLNGLDALRERIPGLSWTRQEGDRVQIRFGRREGDDSLDWLLKRLLGNGHEILNCEVRHGNLREIMERIEQGGGADA